MPTINKEWKKETELRDLKNELAALDRKITLDLAPSKSEKQDGKDAKESQGENKKVVMAVSEPAPERNNEVQKHFSGHKL